MTTIKECLADIPNHESLEDVRLCPIANCKPLIVKMDEASLSKLQNCKQLRLSSNNISEINGLKGMPKLEILSIGRNNLKKISNLAPVAGTLKQLWLSYNAVGSFAGIEVCSGIEVLYASNCKIKEWSEIERLTALPKLVELNIVGNPLYVANDGSIVPHSEKTPNDYRLQVIKRLPNLKNLDGALVEEEEKETAKSMA